MLQHKQHYSFTLQFTMIILLVMGLLTHLFFLKLSTEVISISKEKMMTVLVTTSQELYFAFWKLNIHQHKKNILMYTLPQHAISSIMSLQIIAAVIICYIHLNEECISTANTHNLLCRYFSTLNLIIILLCFSPFFHKCKLCLC